MNKTLEVRHETFLPLPAMNAVSGWVVSRRLKGRQVYAHYIWADQAKAQKFADSLTTGNQVEVNVSQDRPYKMI